MKKWPLRRVYNLLYEPTRDLNSEFCFILSIFSFFTLYLNLCFCQETAQLVFEGCQASKFSFVSKCHLISNLILSFTYHSNGLYYLKLLLNIYSSHYFWEMVCHGSSSFPNKNHVSARPGWPKSDCDPRSGHYPRPRWSKAWLAQGLAGPRSGCDLGPWLGIEPQI